MLLSLYANITGVSFLPNARTASSSSPAKQVSSLRPHGKQPSERLTSKAKYRQGHHTSSTSTDSAALPTHTSRCRPFLLFHSHLLIRSLCQILTPLRLSDSVRSTKLSIEAEIPFAVSSSPLAQPFTTPSILRFSDTLSNLSAFLVLWFVAASQQLLDFSTRGQLCCGLWCLEFGRSCMARALYA
jgi:hypothetical protein